MKTLCIKHDYNIARCACTTEGKRRQAGCVYCGRLIYSDTPLPGYKETPFFKSRPERDIDEYYCGCRGWE